MFLPCSMAKKGNAVHKKSAKRKPSVTKKVQEEKTAVASEKAKASIFSKGHRVEARFDGRSKLFPGVIKKVIIDRKWGIFGVVATLKVSNVPLFR